MKNSFTTGQRGLDLIVEFEGEILKVYNDGFGYPTAGVGHLLSPAEKRAMPIGTKITRQQSRDWLKQDLEEAESAVNSTITVPITQNQFDAMTSLAFNIGTTGFKRSTLARKLNARHFAEAADAFLSWNKSRGKVVAGLARRRKAERALFLTPDSTADQTATDGPTTKNSIQSDTTNLTDGQPPNTTVQNAEAIVNTGSSTAPAGFVPETVVNNAPAPENAVTKSATVTIGGVVVPTFLVAIFTAINSAIQNGFIDAKEVGGAVLNFIVGNQKYSLILLGLLVAVIGLNKLYKQVTLWLSMWINTDPNRHNIVVVPATNTKNDAPVGIVEQTQ
jgi:lysozyme